MEYNRKKEEEKEKKEWAYKKQLMIQKLKSHSEWINDLQKVFNKFIRLRDAGKPCISCGTANKDIDYHAGHLYAAGNYSYLRFNEDNVHLQCGNNCNKNKHGNFAEYRIALIKRIGLAHVEQLERDRHKKLKMTIPEIREKIKYYKTKIKEINHLKKTI